MGYSKGKNLLSLIFQKEYVTGYRKKLKFYNRYVLPFLLLGSGFCFLLYYQRDYINATSAFIFTNFCALGLCGILFFKLEQEKDGRRKLDSDLGIVTARLHHIYNSGIIGLLYTRFDGVITEANDTFLNMIGYSRADLNQGKISWMDMTPPEFLEKNNKALEQLASTGFCEPFEKQYLRKDGSRVFVLLGSSLLRGGDDAQIITYAIDISLLNEAKKKEQLMNLQLRVSMEKKR